MIGDDLLRELVYSVCCIMNQGLKLEKFGCWTMGVIFETQYCDLSLMREVGDFDFWCVKEYSTTQECV